MILKEITLNNFRNYEEQKIEFNEKFNFIYGENGQGKTNILEAVSLSCLTKSFLGASESDCLNFNAGNFFIESRYLNDNGNDEVIGVAYEKFTGKKAVHLNKSKVSSYSSEIFGRIPAVFLSPQDLEITYGNPSERRKFFDILISQTSPLYLSYLKDLVKLVKQKNALFRNYHQHKNISFGELKDLLQSYNEKFIEVSVEIIFKRIEFLKEFLKYFTKNFSYLIKNNQTPGISYDSDALGVISVNGFDNIIKEKIKTGCDKICTAKFDDEIQRGTSLFGPQRDDYVFSLQKNTDTDFFDLKNHASQGEHKTFLVALKLSEYDYLKDKKETNPVLLLDDVLSELDENRVSMIISHLKEFGQIFLTTTNKGYAENLSKFYNPSEMKIFKVINGKVYIDNNEG
ncbi:MAG: DNA replication and repair protein RecF [Ignavibacteria bacterium]|nr:DNA replication and repair protein RecF [Ignavibacteria bacterium]